MDRGFQFGFEGPGGGLVVLSLRRDGTYTVSPSEPRKESPSEPRLPGRSRSRLRSESREPRGARSESRGSSTSRAENEIVSSLENDREKITIFFLSSSRFPHDLTKRILSRGVEGKEKGASRALRRLRTVSQNVGQNVEKENPCRTS